MRAVLISLVPQQGKRRHFGKLPFQRMFNFGLLSVASVAVENGHQVQVWDAADPNFRDEEKLISALRNSHPDIVGLSCISGFSYPSLLTVSADVRRALPQVKIIVGGMDHVGQIPEMVLREAPEVDAVVSGYGEVPFLAIMDAKCSDFPGVPIKGVSVRGQRAEIGTSVIVPFARIAIQGSSVREQAASPADSRVLSPMPALDYRSYVGLSSLPPSVELARGCPFQCSFCVSAGGTLVRRTPADLAEQMLQACIAYDNAKSRIYIEAPLATFSGEYLRLLRSELVARGIQPTWRAECRVDTLHPELADDLAETGCRVLDLGLESASPLVLGWMGKAADPERYIRRSSDLLGALAQSDIFAKVNVMFYAGENEDTLRMTHEFLSNRKSVIGAIAAGPLYLYPGITGESRIRELVREHGGGIVQTDEWRARHMNPVNPSRNLGFDQLLETALVWEREFQSAYDYWYHRRWGYFSPNVAYEEFTSAVLQVGVEHFPFPAETLALAIANNEMEV